MPDRRRRRRSFDRFADYAESRTVRAIAYRFQSHFVSGRPLASFYSQVQLARLFPSRLSLFVRLILKRIFSWLNRGYPAVRPSLRPSNLIVPSRRCRSSPPLPAEWRRWRGNRASKSEISLCPS